MQQLWPEMRLLDGLRKDLFAIAVLQKESVKSKLKSCAASDLPLCETNRMHRTNSSVELQMAAAVGERMYVRR
jgi:hypothetical protein